MGLVEYRRKRHFNKTPEPAGKKEQKKKSSRSLNRFVIQKHAASRLHYDFRLEIDGVLKSWAVPKGPSLDPSVKSLAVHVEDHPIEYGGFEGVIPQGEYGGGTVMLWDHGTWESDGDASKDYRRGKLTFVLHGEKLQGRWALIRMGGDAGEGGKNWLLKKLDDDFTRTQGEFDVLDELSSSVASGRTMDEIAGAADRVWGRKGEVRKRLAPKNGKSTAKSRTAKSTKKKLAKSKSTKRAPKSARTKLGSTKSVAKTPGARHRRVPKSFRPQLATLVKETPEGDEWLHELKFDGYRLLCTIDQGAPKLFTRHGHDWTDRFPTVAAAAADLHLTETILDGEVVVLDANGTSNFQSLQNHLQRGNDDDIVYFVFDIPYLKGYDLTECKQIDRKNVLKELLAGNTSSGVIRYSDHILGHGSNVLQSACRHGIEGVISKHINSRYEQRRSRTWLKTKCLKRQEFVIGGWSDPGGSRHAFGSLILGYYDDQGRLIHCGRVGTGFTGDSLQQIKLELDRLHTTECPFHERPPGRDTHWVQPKLVAEIEFTQWTDEGLLRHPTFQGLREDKTPTEVKREVPMSPVKSNGRHPTQTKRGKTKKTGGATNEKASVTAKGSNDTFAGVRLTNPGRIFYPESKITKRDLAEYYVAVADWIMPHLVHRPLSLVRCPQGVSAKCFYQKHVTESVPDTVRGIEVEEKDGTGVYIAIDNLPGLITLVQLGCLEIHPWGSREDKIDFPDRMIFDLDPGEGVPWTQMVTAARDLRQRLGELGLESFLRTTGGKGLHLVVPLTRRAPWEEVKEFARTIASALARIDPEGFVDTMSKAKRRGKIYVDYLRNDRGSTAIASFSTRARPNAPVATPLHWDELTARLKPERFTIKTVPKRLASLESDPWKDFFHVQQSLSKAMLKSVKEWH